MKKFLKRGCGITALLLLITGALLVGGFLYTTKYKISDIASSLSSDGLYELLYQSVGEPDWPFGDSHAQFVLKRNGKIITKYQFDVANDGSILYPDSWRVTWKENGAEVLISGEEQPDILYTLSFDGTVRKGSAAITEQIK